MSRTRHARRPKPWSGSHDRTVLASRIGNATAAVADAWKAIEREVHAGRGITIVQQRLVAADRQLKDAIREARAGDFDDYALNEAVQQGVAGRPDRRDALSRYLEALGRIGSPEAMT